MKQPASQQPVVKPHISHPGWSWQWLVHLCNLLHFQVKLIWQTHPQHQYVEFSMPENSLHSTGSVKQTTFMSYTQIIPITRQKLSEVMCPQQLLLHGCQIFQGEKEDGRAEMWRKVSPVRKYWSSMGHAKCHWSSGQQSLQYWKPTKSCPKF